MSSKQRRTRKYGGCDGLSREEIEGVKSAFDLFDTNGTGLVNVKEIKSAMASLGFHIKYPAIYKIISDLDTPQIAKRGGVDFKTFVNCLNNILMDRENEDNLAIIFQLFLNDPEKKYIDYKALKIAAKDAERETGKKYSDDDLKDMLDVAANPRKGVITFNEFYDVMTNK